MTIENILSFITGIIITLGGVFLTFWFQRKHEKNREKEKLRFEIYMNLLNISAYYFWVTAAEVNNEKPPNDTRKLLRDLSLKTLDILRQVDDIEFQDEILDILFSEKFATARERSTKFD